MQGFAKRCEILFWVFFSSSPAQICCLCCEDRPCALSCQHTERKQILLGSGPWRESSVAPHRATVTSAWQLSKLRQSRPRSCARRAAFLAFPAQSSVSVLGVTLRLSTCAACPDKNLCGAASPSETRFATWSRSPSDVPLRAGPWTLTLGHCRDLDLPNTVYKIKGML